jgi:hypothetical protein
MAVYNPAAVQPIHGLPADAERKQGLTAIFRQSRVERAALSKKHPGPKPIQVHRHWSVLARLGPEGTGIRFAGMT